MTRTTITYPLRLAISLSQSAGALYKGDEGHLTVQMVNSVNVGSGTTLVKALQQEGRDASACAQFLFKKTMIFVR